MVGSARAKERGRTEKIRGPQSWHLQIVVVLHDALLLGRRLLRLLGGFLLALNLGSPLADLKEQK